MNQRNLVDVSCILTPKDVHEEMNYGNQIDRPSNLERGPLREEDALFLV